MKPAAKADDNKNYQYIIFYIDDVATAMDTPQEFMDEQGKQFTLKDKEASKKELTYTWR